jgi:YD repeat-containing protein
VKNAAIADVAATSFESDGTGNWTYTGTSTSDTTSITGSYCYNLGQTNGNITKSGLTSGTTYVVSYWTKNSSAYSITGTIAGYPIKGKTINGWSYYEHKVTGQTTITVSGSGYLDELRLYPATAQMTTFTYSSLAGMTTSCDADNKVTYYLYDSYQRLKRIRDQDGNIIKTFKYYYVNQNPTSQ